MVVCNAEHVGCGCSSGSMQAGTRIPMVKQAVLKIIDTLTWSDHGRLRCVPVCLPACLPFLLIETSCRCIHRTASLILFHDSTTIYECEEGDIMCPMTPDEKARMKDWASIHIEPDGGTNFNAAFDDAFQALNSPRTSACNKVILFMTDGRKTICTICRCVRRCDSILTRLPLFTFIQRAR